MSVNQFLSNSKKILAKSASISEAEIEEHFVEYSKTVNCKAYKLIILNKRGFPDRTVFTPNEIIFFIEFKQKNKKLDATQKPVKTIIEKFGFDYYICDKIGQAEKILDSYL